MADMVAKQRCAPSGVRGAAHGQSKLTEADVLAIRSAENISQRKLAKQFGVCQQQISVIRLGRRWAHL